MDSDLCIFVLDVGFVWFDTEIMITMINTNGRRVNLKVDPSSVTRRKLKFVSQCDIKPEQSIVVSLLISCSFFRSRSQ